MYAERAHLPLLYIGYLKLPCTVFYVALYDDFEQKIIFFKEYENACTNGPGTVYQHFRILQLYLLGS